MNEKKSKKVDILIIDDDESFSKSLSFTLRKKGYNVEFAFTFDEALEKANENHYNIALVDIKLQDKSGVELVDYLKEIDPEIAIMMITGHASVSTAIESVNLEISAYFTKPVDMNVLLKTISEALEKQELLIRNKELIIQVQKELEERKLAEEKYRMLVETSPNAILLLDIEGKIIFVNKQFLAVRGYENDDEIIGHSIADFSHRDQNKLTKIINELLSNKETKREHEITLFKKDGTTFQAECTTSVVLNQQGEPVFFTAIQKDVTERKKQEKELALRNQISHLFATIPDKEIYSEILNAVLKAMSSKKGIFGYINPKGDLICPSIAGEIWDECQIPEKSIVFPRKSWGDNLWTRALTDREVVYSNEQPTKLPKGHIPIERHLPAPIVYQGETIGLLYIANKESNYTNDDILLMKMITKHIAPILSSKLQTNIEEDQRKKAEWEREDAIKDLEKMFQYSPAFQFTTSLDGYFKRINPIFCKTFGYSESELLASSFIDYVHPDDLEDSLPNIGTLRSGLKTIKFINRFRCKNGDYRWIECISNPIVSDDNIFSIAQDITARKKAEEEIEESELRYRTIFKAAFDSIMIIKDDKFVDCNDVLVEKYGFKNKDEFLGLSPWDISPPLQPDGTSSKEKGMALLEATLAGVPQQFYWVHEFKGRTPFEVNVSLSSFEMHGEKYILAMWFDLTESKKAALDLKHSEELYRTVFDTTGTAMLLTENRKVVVCNKRFFELFGYTREEIEGEVWTKWIFESDHEKMLAIYSNYQKNPNLFPMETEFRIIRNDGEIRTVFAIIDLIPGTVRTVASIQDITTKKNLEEVRSQVYEQLERNMEQFAILVDSIRNPLAVIVGFADIYPEDVTDKIIKQVKLVDDIISELDLRFLESENVRNFLKKHT